MFRKMLRMFRKTLKIFRKILKVSHKTLKMFSKILEMFRKRPKIFLEICITQKYHCYYKQKYHCVSLLRKTKRNCLKQINTNTASDSKKFWQKASPVF